MMIDQNIFYQKPYVLYGIIATLELVYQLSQRDDRMPIFIFRSIIKFHFGLTKKIFNLRLIAGIIDRKFPTFYVPIYPYKSTFSIAMRLLSGTCWKKFPIMSKVLRFHGFPVTKVHNVSRGPVKNVIFPFGQCNSCNSL